MGRHVTSAIAHQIEQEAFQKIDQQVLHRIRHNKAFRVRCTTQFHLDNLSSTRSDSLIVMTQCLLQLNMQAVRTNFGRSFSTANLWITIFHFFWKHLHSLDTVICGALIFRAYSISQGMSRVCPFPFLALVWPFAIFLLGRWLEIYPSTSKQFCGCDPSGLDSEPSTDCWAFTWFCMTTSLQAAIHCSLDAIFQQFFSQVMDFMFLQVALQVRREFQRLSEFQVLHDWFVSLVNRRTIRKIQTLKILPQWFPMLTRPGIEGILHHPADSGDVAVWSLYTTICECGTNFWAAFFRHWFDIHATYSQYMCSHSRKFWALWALRSGIFLTLLGHLAAAFSFRLQHNNVVEKIGYVDCICCRRYIFSNRTVRHRFSLPRWTILCLVGLQTAVGTNQGPDCLGSADECLWPGRDPPTDNSGPMSWLLPIFCPAVVLSITWVFRTWWNFLPTAATRDEVDYASFGAALERLDRENNVLRQEVGALNGALSEIFSVAGRLRDDLDGVTADHDRLAEQVGWQHVGMVRLGGFNPYQSLSIQQRQQVFARERRNMMAYRSTGPSGFMATVLHQDRLLGLQSDFNVIGGVGARLDYPRGEASADTHPLIEFNDVGDGSSLPQDVLWAIARNKLQIELYNCLVREDFVRARLFQQALLFFIDASHQDRLLNRHDQVRLFTYLGDHLESVSDGLQGEDEDRANYYRALAGRFRRVASVH